MRKTLPFVAVVLLALAVDAAAATFGWSETERWVAAAVAGIALITVALPYAFGGDQADRR